MPNIGPTELIVVLIVALLVFGPKRLPEIGRTVGKSLREFRQATNSIRDEMDMGLKDYDEPPPATDAKPPAEPGLASTNGSGSGESEVRLIAEGEGGTSASSPAPPEPTTGEPGRSP